MLGAAAGETNKSIAAGLGCSEATASKWRRRFAVRRLEGLGDDPRPGPPRKVGDEVVEVVVRTLEGAPAGAAHWSTRSMAQAVGISSWSVHQIWRAFGLKPHLVEEFNVSTHKTPTIQRRLVRHPRFKLHFAPPAAPG